MALDGDGQDHFIEHVAGLARLLGLRLSLPAPEVPASSHTPGMTVSPSADEMRLTTAKAWLRASDIERATLGPALTGDPAWRILLDLYIQDRVGPKVSISNATMASGAPHTTAVRYINAMVEAGLIRRVDDPLDRRRTYLRLPQKTIALLESAFDAAVDSDRKLGLARMTVS